MSRPLRTDYEHVRGMLLRVAGAAGHTPDMVAAWKQGVVRLELPKGWTGVVRVDHIPGSGNEGTVIEQNTEDMCFVFHGVAYGRGFVKEVVRRVGKGRRGYFEASLREDGVVVINYLAPVAGQEW